MLCFLTSMLRRSAVQHAGPVGNEMVLQISMAVQEIDAAVHHTGPVGNELVVQAPLAVQETDGGVSAHGRYHEYYYYTRTEEGKQYSVHCRRRVPPGAGPVTGGRPSGRCGSIRHAAASAAGRNGDEGCRCLLSCWGQQKGIFNGAHHKGPVGTLQEGPTAGCDLSSACRHHAGRGLYILHHVLL